jgi:tetratricopeptide (TPR) repeat protein
LHTDLAAYDGWGLSAKSRASHLRAAQRILELIPNEAAFERDWMLTVAYYFHGKDLSVSLNQLKEADRRFPDDAEILLALGVTYETSASVDHDRGMLKNAEDYYRKAIKINSDLPEAHLRLGKVLLDRGGDRLEESKQELEWVVQKASDPYLLHLAHLFLGDLHKERGNLEAAIERYHAAVECEPRWQAAYILLSYALRAIGEWSSSRDVMERALRLPVTDATYVDGYRLYSRGQLIKFHRALDGLRRGLTE